jgi:hypothetical protein
VFTALQCVVTDASEPEVMRPRSTEVRPRATRYTCTGRRTPMPLLVLRDVLLYKWAAVEIWRIAARGGGKSDTLTVYTTGFKNEILRFTRTVYPSVPYGSHNEQRLFPQTALTGWAL